MRKGLVLRLTYDKLVQYDNQEHGAGYKNQDAD